MALFYSPTLTKRTKPKPMSKTALKNALRDLRKMVKEIEQFDKPLATGLANAVTHLSKLEK
jgi:hypothetical protein